MNIDIEKDVKFIHFPNPEYVCFNKTIPNYTITINNCNLIFNNIYDPYDDKFIELKIMTNLSNKELYEILYKNIYEFMNGYSDKFTITKSVNFNYKLFHRESHHLRCLIINITNDDWIVLAEYVICIKCFQLIHKSLCNHHTCFEIIPKKIYIN